MSITIRFSSARSGRFYYLGTTAIAVGIGLVFANIFQPGLGLSLSTEGLQAKEISPPSVAQTLLNIIPLNPAQALAEGNLPQIIFFAIFLPTPEPSISAAGSSAIS